MSRARYPLNDQLRFQSFSPIAWSPALMGKCDNPEILLVFDEDDRIGKSLNKNLPGTNGWGKIKRGCKWRFEETLHTLVDCDSKLPTKSGPLPLIPLFCLDQFVLSFVEDNEPLAHIIYRVRGAREPQTKAAPLRRQISHAQRVAE